LRPARLRKILGEDAALRVVVVDRGAKIGAALGDELGNYAVMSCQHAIPLERNGP